MRTPRELIGGIERGDVLASGDEVFAGYGIMGQPFGSGHVLAFRRFLHSSIGPGYASVWHCDPDGRWEMWSDVSPLGACPRYFGPALAAASQRAIEIEWSDGWTVDVRIDGLLDWRTTIASSSATRLMSAMCRVTPDAFWRSATMLRAMGRVAGPVLRAGSVSMSGAVPSGQAFRVAIKELWATTHVTAVLAGNDIGSPGRVPDQRWLGDFAVPNRGLFAIGQARFDAYRADRHVQVEHAS